MKLFIFNFVALCYLSQFVKSNSKLENDESVLDISAFNVRIFGANKIANTNVMKNLVKILLRYDLILIQEIRDSSGLAIKLLHNELNKEFSRQNTNTKSSASYGLILSPRLGRTASKEEYAYFYRTDLVTATDSFTFNDKDDVFEREPFIVKFHSSLSAVKDFAIAGIHTSPRDASNEISNLTYVYDAIQRKWQLDDAIIMGDFNAGCDYVKEWDGIRLAKDDGFYWIIDHSLDTTAEKSDCPYDRIVAAGKDMVSNILPNSGGVFNYDEELNLSSSEALAVSDHYPVHVQIRFEDERLYSKFSESFTAIDTRVNQALYNKPHFVYNLRTDAKTSAYYAVSENYKSTGAYDEIEVKTIAKNIDDFHLQLRNFQVKFSKFVSSNQVNMVKRFVKSKVSQDNLPHGHGRYKTLYDFYRKKDFDYILKIDCSLKNRNVPYCSLHVTVEQK